MLGLGAVNVADNLIATLADVNLKVTTKRSSHEEEALHQVNNMISKLVFQAQNEVHSTKELCHVYIRSCYQPGENLNFFSLYFAVNIYDRFAFLSLIQVNVQMNPTWVREIPFSHSFLDVHQMINSVSEEDCMDC